ncbi:MAG TPA: ATP-dependent metallopeptidase FtsH/Yme1/Tma family protein, partial [Verrucomicrobiaceae bacterium]
MSVPPDNPKRQQQSPTPPVRWGSLMIYLLMMMAMLWMWQEVLKQVNVRTIPYSEFKQDVRGGRVVECGVGEDDIIGTIQPKEPPKSAS